MKGLREKLYPLYLKMSVQIIMIHPLSHRKQQSKWLKVKCYHMLPLVTTGYHLAPSEKSMLPHLTDQSKMAKRSDSSSFRAIHPPGAEI